MGVLSSITNAMLGIVRENDPPMDPALMTPSQLMSIAREEPILRGEQMGLLNVPAPKSLDYFEESSIYFVSVYQRASYYFYNCSILNTVIRKIVDEALRNGIEFVPRFQSKCPKCGTYMVEKGNKLVCANDDCRFVKSQNDN